MEKGAEQILRERLDERQYGKLAALKNPHLHEFIARFVEHLNPDTVFVGTDSPEDIDYCRKAAIGKGEERPLKRKGHTIHFDSYYDQARDKDNTRILLDKGIVLGDMIETKDREEGLRDVLDILKGIMKGKEMYVRFFCLGPLNSAFSIPCVQLTDSAYVAHNEDLLYRQGCGQFKKIGASPDFLRFVHSAGELEKAVCKNIDKRRVFIDLAGNTVYSANTQYGGNTIGLKKLAMRLTIQKASREGWLTEHMLIMGIRGPKGRVSYFTGAFPSMCGKTSTSMVEGELIVGDDIAYLRRRRNAVYGVNVEKGIFGIIQGINRKDDKLLWDALHSEGEIIFSNILYTEDGDAYWIDKDSTPPKKGINHGGEWYPGKKDAKGNLVDVSHKNARFTLDMKLLANRDPEMENPEGVKISGVIYGGRDSDTWVPLEESYDWEHGIITKGATLESETTAATLGKEGVRQFNPMSNLDFLSVTIGRYVRDNLEFGKGIADPPRIFSVNYFLKDKAGRWLNEREDKRVWLKWMELRVHGDVDAVKTPTGFIPRFEDLKGLYKQVLSKEYGRENYVAQFTLRLPENVRKTERIIKLYEDVVLETPPRVFTVLEEQKARLLDFQGKRGDYVSPFDL